MICPGCDTERLVNVDGTIRRHQHPIFHYGCPGSGQSVRPHVHRCADCAARWDEHAEEVNA